MNNKDFTQLLDQYLSGNDLDKKQTEIVEAGLLKDTALCAQTAESLKPLTIGEDLKNGISLYGRGKLNNKLNLVFNELKKEGFFLTEEDLNKLDEGLLEDEKLNQFRSLEKNEQALEKDLSKGIQLHGKEELKSKLENVEKDLKQEAFFKKETEAKVRPIAPKKSASVFNLNRIASIAAAVLLFLSVWFVFSIGGSANDDLFAEFNQPMEDKISDDINDVLGGFGFAGEEDAKQYKILQECMESYNKGAFSEAVNKFKNYRLEYPEDQDAQFYSAVSYLNENNIPEASVLLSLLAADEEFEFNTDAKWYLALAQLKLGNPDETKKILKKLDGTNYQTKAAALLAKL